MTVILIPFHWIGSRDSHKGVPILRPLLLMDVPNLLYYINYRYRFKDRKSLLIDNNNKSETLPSKDVCFGSITSRNIEVKVPVTDYLSSMSYWDKYVFVSTVKFDLLRGPVISVPEKDTFSSSSDETRGVKCIPFLLPVSYFYRTGVGVFHYLQFQCTVDPDDGRIDGVWCEESSGYLRGREDKRFTTALFERSRTPFRLISIK